MKNHTILIPVIMIFVFLSLAACTGSLDSSDSLAAPGIGIDRCYACHMDTGYSFYNPSFALTNQQIYAVWASSGHGNLETHYSYTFGITTFGFPDLDNYMEESCVPCHDPNMDSQYVSVLAADGAPGGSITPRPVVGCEACHGSGDGHMNASFPVPYPVPDYERCGQCHNSDFDHNLYHPEADNLLEDYIESKHIRSLAPFSNLPIAPLCAACHSDEGARIYVDMDWAAVPAGDPPISDAHPVQCRTCHDAHDPGRLQARSVGIGSEEFRLCNRCHLLDDGAGNPGVHYHEGWGDEYLITDTHIAAAGSFPGGSFRGANQNAISGYAVSPDNERVCRNCHNVHSGDLTINKQWVMSAHADTSAPGAWAHYNWTERSGEVRSDGSSASNREACQRCHTTTGYIAFADAGAPSDTSYYPDLLPFDPDYKPEMLYCYGCHEDNAGGLRDPGPYTARYDVISGGNVLGTGSFAYTDLAGSNVCMPCHTARISGEAIGNINNPSVSFSNISFLDGHYLSAGATLFMAAGYEFAYTSANVYANYSFYAHDGIGIDEVTEVSVNGPCVGCHLTSNESHGFMPVDHSPGGEITEITSDICNECHTGQYALSPEELEEQKEGFHAAMDALEHALADNGLFFKPNYPYFFNTSGGFPAPQYWQYNWLTSGDTNTNGSQTGKNNMGAAFNFSLLHHEPGAWAHNRLYGKLLIFDSINWLEAASAVANSSVYTLPVPDSTIDLSAFPSAARYIQGDDDTANDSSVNRPGIY